MPDGPGGFPQGFSCPAVLRCRLGEVRAFAYRAFTSCGRPFQAVRLTLAFSFAGGPATPPSPFEVGRFGLLRFRSPLLSESLACFLLLRVLRWFTSPGSLRGAMDSPRDGRCSHRPGFPIRTSPDHSLLATPRGFSQLAASFFACLRLGIHTHALSSLTVKSTPHTECTWCATSWLPVSILLSKIKHLGSRCQV